MEMVEEEALFYKRMNGGKRKYATLDDEESYRHARENPSGFVGLLIE